MTGAFEEGDGKIFGSPAKTVENNFFCIFCGWWRAPSKKEKEIIFVSSVSDDGRLRRRGRRLFLYLLRVIRASSRKEGDNFLCLRRKRRVIFLYLPRRQWRRNFFLRDFFCTILKGTIVVISMEYIVSKRNNLSLQFFQNYEIILQRWASRNFMNSIVRYSVCNNFSRWWLSISHKRECWWAVWVHYFDKPC